MESKKQNKEPGEVPQSDSLRTPHKSKIIGHKAGHFASTGKVIIGFSLRLLYYPRNVPVL
jgi:hypothetical protein